MVQDVYGKTANDLEVILAVFTSVLGNFKEKDIADAFKQHMMNSPKFPAPADIYKICVEITTPKWWEKE
jgi:hypothetical protein